MPWRRISIAIAAALASGPLQAQSALEVGALRQFGDWVVGCDNFRTCTAIGMGADDAVSGYVVLSRGGAPADSARVSLSILASDTSKDPTLQVVVHPARASFPPATLPVEAVGGYLVAAVDPTMTPSLIPAIAAGDTLHLTEIDGATSATPQVVSLTGSTAALLYLDDQQKRVRTVTALLRPGRSAATTMPPVPEATPPQLVAMAELADPLPPLPAGVTASDDADCGADFGPIAFALSPTETLWGVCDNAGAYNIDYIMWLVGPEGARKADFTLPGTPPDPDSDPADLTNPSLTGDALGLGVFAKGRGLGDCGTAASWGWDGARFVLLQYQEMDVCRGVDPADWPVLYRTAPL